MYTLFQRATGAAAPERSSSWIMSKDRGGNLRVENVCNSLLQEGFPAASTSIFTGLIRLPYTDIVLEGYTQEQICLPAGTPWYDQGAFYRPSIPLETSQDR
jgi:hypothetical protein